MKGISRYRSLAVKDRALVAVAVLLDGHDAADYLSSDKEHQLALSRAAKDLAEVAPDLRMPLLGSLLRRTLDEMR